MIKVEDLKPTEFFYFYRTPQGMMYWFASDRLNKYCMDEKLPIVRYDIAIELFQYLLENGGIENDRLDAMPRKRMNVPCLTIEWFDGRHVLIDGAHRVVKRRLRNIEWFDTYLVKPDIWQKFLIQGMCGSAEYWERFRKTDFKQGAEKPFKLG